jgi:N-acetylglutamate synthase-like GNAT family acetyltransferase
MAQTQHAQSFQLLSSLQCWCNEASKGYILDAARLLQAQWPRGGTINDYTFKLLGFDSNDVEKQTPLSQTESTSLPCSYLLIHKSGKFAGHGRLSECFEGRGGNAAAATYIVVEPRQNGYGTILMKLLEQEAIKLGYHYMYLWTTKAIEFYNKLGYNRTERVSLNSACLKSLQADQVGALEAMLAQQSTSIKRRETVTLPPDAVTANDVWLRKRLVETVASIAISLNCRLEEIYAEIKHYPIGMDWEYYMLSIPWQQQIGPSCGLTALNMLRDYYISPSDVFDHIEMPSLLKEAQSKNYSIDGEVFDAANIVKLAEYCRLPASLEPLQHTSFVDMTRALKNGGTFILPYDSQPFTKKPFKNFGKSAHYGIIVGILLGYQRNEYHAALPTVTEISDFDMVPNADIVLLLIQHGLSSNLSIASFDDFISSNQQLKSIDTSKCKLPKDGVLNLCDCIVVFKS